MNKQKVYLNSCEIIIESIELKKQLEEQQVYFIWKKGKKFSKSNLYDIQHNQNTIIGEKLELSLKIYMKNGKPEMKNTRFYVMVCQQRQENSRELSCFTLGVHQWSNNRQKIKLEIKDSGRIFGIVNLQIKKRQVMQLQNFHKYSAEIEESSEGQSTIVVVDLDGNRAHGELVQLQKQLEDLKYLNDKLKKDRAYLLTRNESIEKEIISIKSGVEVEVNRMKQYYQKKLQVHTSIYQQQIQQLITTFNETSKTNTIIMKSIIHQNQSLAAQLTELRMISQEELQKQNIHYKNKLAEVHEDRERLEDTIQEQLLKIDQLERDLSDVNKRLESTRSDLDDLTLNYEIDKKENKGKCESYEKQLDTQRKLIADMKNQLTQKTQQLKASKQQEIELNDELDSLNQMMEKFKIDRMKTQAQLLDKKQLIQVMRIEKEQNIQTIKTLQSQYEKYIEESEKKGISYQKQLQEIQLQSKEKEIQFDKIINEQRQKYFDENIKLTQVTMKLEDFQKIMIVKDEEVKAYMDDNAKLNQQFLQEHRKVFQYEQQMRELFEQNEHYKMLQESAESKVNIMTEQLNACYAKNKQDLETLRDHFEDSMKSREKYYEEEIQNLRAKNENGESSYLKLATDFRIQIELYKEQIDKSQQELLKQMKQISEITSKNKSLEIECMQYQQLLAEAKNQMMERQKKYEEAMKIQFRNDQLMKSKLYKIPNQVEEFQGEEMKNSVNNFLNPKQSMALQVPRLARSDSIPDPEQIQYLKCLQEFGSLDHLRHLLTLEQSKKDNEYQMDRIYSQNRELQDKNRELTNQLQKDRQEVHRTKQQNQHLAQLIEQLKQELRFYLEKEQEKQGAAQARSQYSEIHRETINKGNVSFRSDQEKIYDDKSAQDSKQKRSLNKSRISRMISFINNTKQQEVQVEIITLTQLQNLRKQLEVSEQQNPKNIKESTKNIKDSSKNVKQQNVKNLKQSKLKSESPIQSQPPKENKEQMALQRQNSGLLKKIAQFQNERIEWNQQLKIKQIRIEKLQQRNRELFEQFAHFKQQMGLKMQMQESKLLEYSQMTKKQDEQVSKMKNTLLQKQQQIRDTQHNLSLRITKTDYENQQLKAENKKMKKQLEELEEKSKKNVNHNDFHKIMQQDIEDANRKIIQLNRNVNQLRMEKQSAEDEVRILKKKATDTERSLMDVTQKRAIAEEQSEIAIRKFNKLKRDFDEKQQELVKYKESHKKIQEEIASYNALSSQNLLERKRGLQQKLQLEEEINKKNAQIRKLTKQLQKQMQKISQSDEFTKQKKNASTKQIERLEIQLSKQKKLAMQFEQQNSHLTHKIQTMEEQNKKRAEEQKQQYREKLSSLANDIVQVKNELEVNNSQRLALMEEKLAIKEELDDCVEYINRLEQLKDRLQRQRGEWVDQIGKMEHQLVETKKELIHYQQDSIDLHTKIVNLQEELNKQRLISARKSEKVQQYQHLSQKYLYELKNNKVTIAQLQAAVETDNTLRSTITQLQNQLTALSQRFGTLNQEYHQYKLRNIYSREQVQQLVVEMKENYEELRKKQLADTIDELDQEYESKNIKRQKQIIELYNENAKTKMEIQRKEDQNAQLLQKYTEVEPYLSKYKKLRQEHDQLSQEFNYLQQQVQSSEGKYQKYELSIKQLQRVIADLKHEVTRSKSQLANEKTKATRLQQDLLESQTAYNMAKEEVKKIATKGNQISDNHKTLIQNQEQKILSIELENMRVKEREENLHRQYKEQVSKLESKIKQAISVMQQENTNLERTSKAKLEQKERQLKQINRNLNSVTANYQQIVNELDIIKGQNGELAIELANTRMQMSEDQEIYICQINKLKNNIRQMEEIYNYNVNALEQELADLNRQLTSEKLANRQQSNLSSSRLRQSEVERRFQEKMKNKDTKIEDLKSQIFILEETIGNMRKKEQLGQETPQNETSMKYRSLYHQLANQIQNMKKKHEVQRSTYEQTQKQLRKELAHSKQKEQNLKLQYDQQTLELQSIRCQLNTTKEVYETLQKQLEKRQFKLVDNLNTQTTHERQIEQKQIQIRQMQNLLTQMKTENEQLKAKIKERQNEIAVTAERLRQQKAMVNRMSRNDSKKLTELKLEQNQQLKDQIERLVKQNKKLSSEIDIVKNQLIRVRNRESELEKQDKKTSKQNAELMQKLYESQDIVGKYMVVNEKSLQNHGVSVEQLVLGGFLDEKFFDQEQELNRLREQVEEMKFTEDRKNLDIEEIRRQNLQLSIKMEDYDYINEQVDTLRKICDKLEEQKKIAVFREEAIRIRLSNLVNRNEARENIRDGLQAILNYNYHVYT